MADDDGLVLNFATSDRPSRLVVTQSAPKSGRWKDRMEQRRKLRSDTSKVQLQARKAKLDKEKPLQSESSNGHAQAQNDKVQQVLAEINASSGNAKKAGGAAPNGKAGAELSYQAGRQIVSSLFTRNPDIPALARASDQENRVTSNAVLDTSSFTGIGLHPDMVGYLSEKLEITKPTAIQQNAIPVMTNKSVQDALADTSGDDTFDVERSISVEHDVFIQAATGSGKTLSYMLPIFHRLIQATAMS
ncbi:ATP-dependent RNA helicase dbp7, partial [Coemansia sp. RSA 2131]